MASIANTLAVLALAGAGIVPVACARRAPAPMTDAAPAVVTVARSGPADFQSIQEAVDHAPAGAIVRVGPGRWVETVLITRPITLEGSGCEHTSLAPPGARRAALERATQRAERRLHDARTPEARNRARLAMLSEEFRPALLVKDAAGVTLRGLRISQLPPDRAEHPLGPCALGIVNSAVVVEDCVVCGSTRDGVAVLGACDVVFRRCLAAGAWGAGVSVMGLTGVGTPIRVLIEDCEVRNNYQTNVLLRQTGTGVAIEHCRVSGSAGPGIRCQEGSSPSITRSTVFGNGQAGLWIGPGPTAAIVRHNLIYANSGPGLSLEPGGDDLLERNTIAFNGKAGLARRGDAPLRLSHNIFYRNAAGLDWNGTLMPDAAALERPGLIPEMNLWVERRAATGVEPSDSSGVTAGAGVEPPFANPAAGDLRLPEGWCAPFGEAGAAGFPDLQSPRPLQPEELAILPPAHTRGAAYWTPPAQAWSVHAND
ncbi:MAG: hypothetical protein Kow0059_13950 [Candidatus Sumerlaeia bacterium]